MCAYMCEFSIDTCECVCFADCMWASFVWVVLEHSGLSFLG